MPASLGLPGPAAYKDGQRPASSLSVRPGGEDTVSCKVVSLSVAGFMRIMVILTCLRE